MTTLIVIQASHKHSDAACCMLAFHVKHSVCLLLSYAYANAWLIQPTSLLESIFSSIGSKNCNLNMVKTFNRLNFFYDCKRFFHMIYHMKSLAVVQRLQSADKEIAALRFHTDWMYLLIRRNVNKINKFRNHDIFKNGSTISILFIHLKDKEKH